VPSWNKSLSHNNTSTPGDAKTSFQLQPTLQAHKLQG